MKRLAPRARFELATLRLTAECSTIELPGNRGYSSAFERQISLVDLQLWRQRASKDSGAASLETLSLGVEANQGIEDCQHMPPVFGDSFEGNPLFGLAQAFAIPFCQYRGRNLDIAAQLFG